MARHRCGFGKYPRVRGEEAGDRSGDHIHMEIPPRARGREIHPEPLPRVLGNTPACAGKSGLIGAHDRWLRKYPRVRGEE